ncbi:hypothetical protein PCE1_003148 [Barthelona sp. PCE]
MKLPTFENWLVDTFLPTFLGGLARNRTSISLLSYLIGLVLTVLWLMLSPVLQPSFDLWTFFTWWGIIFTGFFVLSIVVLVLFSKVHSDYEYNEQAFDFVENDPKFVLELLIRTQEGENLDDILNEIVVRELKFSPICMKAHCSDVNLKSFSIFGPFIGALLLSVSSVMARWLTLSEYFLVGFSIFTGIYALFHPPELDANSFSPGESTNRYSRAIWLTIVFIIWYALEDIPYIYVYFLPILTLFPLIYAFGFLPNIKQGLFWICEQLILVSGGVLQSSMWSAVFDFFRVFFISLLIVCIESYDWFGIESHSISISIAALCACYQARLPPIRKFSLRDIVDTLIFSIFLSIGTTLFCILAQKIIYSVEGYIVKYIVVSILSVISIISFFCYIYRYSPRANTLEKAMRWVMFIFVPLILPHDKADNYFIYFFLFRLSINAPFPSISFLLLMLLPEDIQLGFTVTYIVSALAVHRLVYSYRNLQMLFSYRPYFSKLSSALVLAPALPIFITLYLVAFIGGIPLVPMPAISLFYRPGFPGGQRLFLKSTECTDQFSSAFQFDSEEFLKVFKFPAFMLPGSCFIFKKEELGYFVQVIESNMFYQKYQIRGFELAGTYCQNQEYTALADATVDKTGFSLFQTWRYIHDYESDGLLFNRLVLKQLLINNDMRFSFIHWFAYSSVYYCNLYENSMLESDDGTDNSDTESFVSNISESNLIMELERRSGRIGMSKHFPTNLDDFKELVMKENLGSQASCALGWRIYRNLIILLKKSSEEDLDRFVMRSLTDSLQYKDRSLPLHVIEKDVVKLALLSFVYEQVLIGKSKGTIMRYINDKIIFDNHFDDDHLHEVHNGKTFFAMETGSIEESARPILLSVRRDESKVSFFEINAESVRSQWMLTISDQLYFKNEIQERDAIQNHAPTLRNLICQIVDAPLGYSPFITQEIISK